MHVRYAATYIDQLLSQNTLESQCAIIAALHAAPHFDQQAPNYGLPDPLFLLIEIPVWHSQSVRSGVWTYYEAVSPARQIAMHRALISFAPSEYGTMYERGSAVWESPELIAVVDQWLRVHESAIDEWLHEFAKTNRSLMIEQLC